MKKQKSKTSYIRKQINEIVHEALKDEHRDNEKLFRTLWEIGQDVWLSLIDSYYSRLKNYVQMSDLQIAAREGLYYAITRLKQTPNPFAYIRRCVRGFILEQIKKTAFLCVPHTSDEKVDEIERVPLDSFVDDDEDVVDEPCPEALVFYDDRFAEIEIRDVIEKKLSELERKVVSYIVEGYTVSEVSDMLSVEKDEIEAALKSAREKLKDEFNWR